jgi:histidyl-tRNA synthetase
MATKDNRLKARLPRGLADRSAAEIRATDRMIATIRGVYEGYGFEPVETPLIEYSDALGKFLPDQDRPNEGVFSFQDDPGSGSGAGQGSTSGAGATSGASDAEWLSLRYDLTAPLARTVAENYERLPKPYRSYRFGWVFRNEKPGPGRFRQFMQFDADTVGASSPAADAEMCMMAADTMEALGIARGDYVIKVNSRKVLDGVMEAAQVADRQRISVMRALDKRDRLGLPGVVDLLGVKGREDESGDYTRGVGLSDSQIEILLNTLGWGEPGSGASSSVANGLTIGNLSDSLSEFGVSTAGADELATINAMAESAGYTEDRIRIDPSVVRGLEYYTGAVFEAELLFDVPNERGEKVVFGSVGGGGRYDGLVGRFRGEDVPATGFSLGVSRLAAALAALGETDAAETAGPVVVLVMDRDRMGDYQRMVSMLREGLNADRREGEPVIGVEMYLGDSGMRAQMKYADKRNAPLVVIQGDDELAKGVVQIKDLALGKQLSADVTDNAEWREERPGQFEVAEAGLVEAVRRTLGRP